jgi:hypothetical protein
MGPREDTGAGYTPDEPDAIAIADDIRAERLSR